MTNSDFRTALTDLGWTQGHLAARLGLHRNTVTNWAQGYSDVPQYAAEYLRMARKLKEAMG